MCFPSSILFYFLFLYFFIYYLFYFLLLFYLERKTTEPSCRFVSDSWVSWLHYYQVVVLTHVGEGHVFWCQPSIPSQDSSVPALPNFGLLLYLCRHRRTSKFGLVTHMGRGVFYEVRHHCVCTNASRRLSATAEFLVRCSYTFMWNHHRNDELVKSLRSVFSHVFVWFLCFYYLVFSALLFHFFLGAMQICIARTSYGNVSGWLGGCLSQPVLYQND